MEQLVTVLQNLHEALSALGDAAIRLPAIVAIGGQSSGKSSVLENIVGRDFLPRGTGIVTRRPVMMYLHNVPPPSRLDLDYPGSISEVETGEWAEFQHRPGHKYTNFDEVRDEIVREMERVAGRGKAISESPIMLTIHSPNVPDLVIIDTPGLTKVPVGDQPPDIEVMTRNLCMWYIQQPNNIILAVHPANQDLANSDALKLALEVDPEGERTIGVLTKVDLMDHGTDARDILSGKVVPLKRGFVPMVSRSAKDIAEGMGIKAGLQKERSFFERHPAYRNFTDRCGTACLTRILSNMLFSAIKSHLPAIKSQLSLTAQSTEQQLRDLGDPVDPSKPSEQGQLLLRLLNRFAQNFCDMLEGRVHADAGSDLLVDELFGGARLAEIVRTRFNQWTAEWEILMDESLRDEEILMALRNSAGTRTAVFIPQQAFESLARRQIAQLKDLGRRFADEIYDELRRVAERCEPPQLHRFGELREKAVEIVQGLLQKSFLPTVDMIDRLVDFELSHINTSHPDFIGPERALELVLTAEESQEMEYLDDQNPTHQLENGPHPSRRRRPSIRGAEHGILAFRDEDVGNGLESMDPAGLVEEVDTIQPNVSNNWEPTRKSYRRNDGKRSASASGMKRREKPHDSPTTASGGANTSNAQDASNALPNDVIWAMNRLGVEADNSRSPSSPRSGNASRRDNAKGASSRGAGGLFGNLIRQRSQSNVYSRVPARQGDALDASSRTGRRDARRPPSSGATIGDQEGDGVEYFDEGENNALNTLDGAVYDPVTAQEDVRVRFGPRIVHEMLADTFYESSLSTGWTGGLGPMRRIGGVNSPFVELPRPSMHASRQQNIIAGGIGGGTMARGMSAGSYAPPILHGASPSARFAIEKKWSNSLHATSKEVDFAQSALAETSAPNAGVSLLVVPPKPLPENITPSDLLANEKERREIQIIRLLLTSYLAIVRKNYTDLVPKTVICMLVNRVKDEISSELVHHLYAQITAVDSLLKETDDVAERRRSLLEQLSILHNSLNILSAIRDAGIMNAPPVSNVFNTPYHPPSSSHPYSGQRQYQTITSQPSDSSYAYQTPVSNRLSPVNAPGSANYMNWWGATVAAAEATRSYTNVPRNADIPPKTLGFRTNAPPNEHTYHPQLVNGHSVQHSTSSNVSFVPRSNIGAPGSYKPTPDNHPQFGASGHSHISEAKSLQQSNPVTPNQEAAPPGGSSVAQNVSVHEGKAAPGPNASSSSISPTESYETSSSRGPTEAAAPQGVGAPMSKIERKVHRF